MCKVARGFMIKVRGKPFYLHILNTNHMQERNSLETRDRLNELFEGDYGRQFEIKEK